VPEGDRRPGAHIFAAADSPSCDIVTRLVDVHPDGTAINVSDGNVRVWWKEAGVRELEITMSPTAIMFDTGHAVRLEVAGTSFPVLDRNPGTRMPAVDARAHELRAVTQVVFHDHERPSSISLPIVR
jgi:putative CocE/NonD family hydrolase